MRNGMRAITLASGALALAMVALPGTSQAMPGPALGGLGSLNSQANIERAIGPSERLGPATGVVAPEKITYRSRYYYRGNPFWSYRYYRSPRYRYYGAPRYRYGKGRAYYYNSWKRKLYRPNYYRW